MSIQPAIFRRDAAKDHKVWRNIIARGVIAAAEQGRFDLHAVQSSLLFDPPSFPMTYSFALGDDFVGIAAVQCSTDFHLLMRVNMFAAADLAWRSEQPVFDTHRPIACAESWFHLPSGEWFDHPDEGTLWSLPAYLDELAELEADLSAGRSPLRAA